FLRLLVSLGIVAALAFAVIKIPALYRAIGVRLVSMYDYLMNEDYAADFSVNKRMSLIYMAKIFFYEHPFRGIGLNNFAARYTKTVTYVGYAHNNFWEIAADLGIIGVLVYYWFYIYLLIRHFKQILLGNKLSILFFSYVLILLLTEYGQVSYYDRLQQMMLAISFSALFVSFDAEGNVPASENVQEDDDYGAADYADGLREER
ncbi:MAG TPA: O-antigen ligase family protein, partial [Clostridiales bacterium]|nr:O-antigen ligase family protein [Clostridiales bacterium]